MNGLRTNKRIATMESNVVVLCDFKFDLNHFNLLYFT